MILRFFPPYAHSFFLICRRRPAGDERKKEKTTSEGINGFSMLSFVVGTFHANIKRAPFARWQRKSKDLYFIFFRVWRIFSRLNSYSFIFLLRQKAKKRNERREAKRENTTSFHIYKQATSRRLHKIFMRINQ